MNQRGFLTERAIVWLVAIAACLALWAGAVHLFHAWTDSLLEEGRNEIRAAWSQAVKTAEAQLAADRAAKDAQHQENQRVEALARARLADDAARSRAAEQRMRQQLAAFLAARRDDPQGQAAAPGGAGQRDSSALDLLADLYSRADSEAGILGQYADQLRAAGQACERWGDVEVKP